MSPVVHGVPLIWNEGQSPVGANLICSELKKRSDENNPEFVDLELNLYDDIIARLGYIRGLEHIKNPPQVCSCIEILFNFFSITGDLGCIYEDIVMS